MVKWKLDKNWFNLVVHVLGLNEVIIATKSGLGYVFLKTLDQSWILFREIRVGVNRSGNPLEDHEIAWVGSQGSVHGQTVWDRDSFKIIKKRILQSTVSEV